ncbi:Pycsar system effector family protein [Ulvibacterium sp.]|uniref:Pycsar system effector family protein n=1 Tax=Ulvibacterium sp. TaxID=2665914 RepID=UPI003BA9379B
MSNILEKTEQKVTHLLTHSLGPEFLFHNLRHTQRVVASAKEIMESMDFSDEHGEILLIASWFHDVGYTKEVENHEESSCEIVEEFLKIQGKTDDYIHEVHTCIRATKHSYEPITVAEQVIRDADAAHLAQKDYLAVAEVLREELSLLGIASYSVEEWRKKNIEMFRAEHRFYTKHAQENWQKGKDKNLKKLVKSKKKRLKLEKKENLKAKLKNQSPDRGIQTLYRVTLRNHIKLSDIADTKANILLSVNAIIISLALANLVPKLDNPSNDYLYYPTFIFIIFSIVSMVMSILATRPNVTRGEFTKEDVRSKKVNLLFFGNFHKMQLEQYNWAMMELIKDKEYIYKSLTKDLYYLGVVLERKYRLLRWTYTIFMIGMILSVIAFGIALKYFGPERVLNLPDLTQ